MERYITAKEIMESTGLSRNTVYAMMNLPSFPSTRIGRRLVVSESAFHEWMRHGGAELKGA